MNQDQWNAVDEYIGERLALSDAALDAAIAASAAAGLPAIQVAPNQGKLLMLLARLVNARNILEIGTLGGYSTIWLARGLNTDGNRRVISLEVNPAYAEVARANIARACLASVVDVRIGRGLESLPRLAAEGWGTPNGNAFDLAFIDADKASTPEYFAWALRLTRRGCLIIVDNVVREGSIVNAASEDASVQGVRRFYDMLAANQKVGRVSATALQTVGVKGWDGLAIALVTSDRRD